MTHRENRKDEVQMLKSLDASLSDWQLPHPINPLVYSIMYNSFAEHRCMNSISQLVNIQYLSIHSSYLLELFLDYVIT